MANENAHGDYGVALVGIGAFVLLCVVAIAANALALFYTALGLAYGLIMGCLLIDYYVCLGVAAGVRALGHAMLPKSLFSLISGLAGLIVGILGALSWIAFLLSFLYLTYRFGGFGIGVRVQDLVKDPTDAVNQIAHLFEDTWGLVITNFTTFGLGSFALHSLRPRK